MKTEADKIKSREYSRIWRLRHPEKYRESWKKGNAKPTAKTKNKEWRIRKKIQDPTFFARQLTRWRLKNPDKWRDMMRRAKAKRYHTSPRHRLKDLVSGHIRKAAKKNGYIKTKRTAEMLGCSIPFLRSHLESLFKDGMSWKNIGKFGWHIDHVIPVSRFDLSKPEEQEKCFNYKNLQPLWWRDNLIKGDKICH